jgi:hypothetical protein
VKRAEKLDNERVIQKLEIERLQSRASTGQGVDWGIVTERNIPKTIVRIMTGYIPPVWLRTCSSRTLGTTPKKLH